MKNKFFIILLTFLTLFFYQSKAWSYDKKIQNIDVKIDRTIFLVSDESSLKTINIEKNNTNLWFVSILIPGLGQMLMGDIERGLKYTLLVYIMSALTILSFILAFYTQPRLIPQIPGYRDVYTDVTDIFGPAWLLFPIIFVISVAFYIINVVDSYNMSHEEDKDIELSQKKLETIIEVINTIKISNNGTLSLHVFSF